MPQALDEIDIKLLAELHEVYGVPATGPLRGRAMAYVVAWSERRGIDPLSSSLWSSSLRSSLWWWSAPWSSSAAVWWSAGALSWWSSAGWWPAHSRRPCWTTARRG